MGGGSLYIQKDGMDQISREVWGSPDSGDHAGRYTQQDIDFIMPLLEKQSYIKYFLQYMMYYYSLNH